MSAAKTHTAETKTRASGIASNNLQNIEKVRAIFASLVKYIHAKSIYTSNNPNVGKFADTFYETFRLLFEHEKELVLSIEQYQIKWENEVVYSNNENNTSIAFLLFKDGIGEITFLSTVKQAELDQFVDLIKNEIYNPSAHLDIVSRLWQAEFKDIYYRVFDESMDGAEGEGGKSSNSSQENPLLSNDHKSTEGTDENDASTTLPNNPFCSLGGFLSIVAERGQTGASPLQKEESLQNTLFSFFEVNSSELEAWQEEFFSTSDQDKLLWLLDVMVDFTQSHCTPATSRDVMDTIDRVVRYIIAEAKLPVVIALLDVQEKIAQSTDTSPEFQFLPDRIYRELTNNAFLLLLGKNNSSSRDKAQETLRYFQLLGKVSVPGICAMLECSKDSLVHRAACDVLLRVSGADILSIVEDFDLENPHEAGDAVYLIQRAFPGDIPPIITRIMSSPDPLVRAEVIELLALAGTDEAASRLCGLMVDNDKGVRIKAFTAAEKVPHPTIVGKITALCFDDDTRDRDVDELERMFRTVGILGGEKILEQLTQLTRKKGWIPFGKRQGKQDKLLAVLALRHIPGERSIELLRKLANDHDGVVKTRASYVLKRLGKPDDEPAPAVTIEAK